MIGSQFVAFFYILMMHFCRQQDYRNRGSTQLPFETYKDLEANHLGYHDVEKNEVRLLLLQASKEFLAAVTAPHVKSILFQLNTENFNNVAVIVNHHDSEFASWGTRVCH